MPATDDAHEPFGLIGGFKQTLSRARATAMQLRSFGGDEVGVFYVGRLGVAVPVRVLCRLES